MPVVDEDGCLVKVLSCRDLFRHTLPEMFFTMKTLSFARYMDPFSLNLNRNGIFVRDIRTDRKTALPVAEVDSTLTELIFQMCACQFDTLFILDRKKLKGVINRYALVDKILIGMEH